MDDGRDDGADKGEAALAAQIASMRVAIAMAGEDALAAWNGRREALEEFNAMNKAHAAANERRLRAIRALAVLEDNLAAVRAGGKR